MTAQVRYWLSRPPAERLAQAEACRVRVFGDGPFALKRTSTWLPSVVSSPDEVSMTQRPPTEPLWQFCDLFRVKAALEALGLDDLSDMDPEVWAKSRALLRIGESPLQIDVLLQISGLDYHAATIDAVSGAYGEVPVRFLGRDALITNKKASGRPKDLADVDLLMSDDPGR